MKKKLFSLLLIAVMVLSSFSAVFADDVAISVPSTDNHTYEIYQIFTGDLSGEVLSNVKYGQNAALPSEKSVGDPVDASVLTEIAAISGTDAAKASQLKAYADLTTEAFKTVAGGASVNVPTGYYLIKDKYDAQGNPTLAEGEDETLYIVEIVGPTTIARKAGKTTSDKKVDDVNDSTGVEQKLQESSDYDIGDDVPYTLTATLTESVNKYTKYHITFKDQLDAGKLKNNKDYAVTIKYADGTTETLTKGTGYTVSNETDNGFNLKLEWTVADYMNADGKTSRLDGAEITVKFTAELLAGAVIGKPGNVNKMTLEYSNNPNDVTGNETDETPEEQVVTFTYKVIVNKQNENKQPLSGAGFTLYKIPAGTPVPTGDDAKDAAAKNEYYKTKAIKTWECAEANPDTQFTFERIDDGTYVLCETKTPSGYNTANPHVFVVEATHTPDNGTGAALTALTGTGDITLEPNVEAGSLTGVIVNQKGSTLPETGGIGTTIIYILGAALVIGAGVMLVTRKKMND